MTRNKVQRRRTRGRGGSGLHATCDMRGAGVPNSAGRSQNQLAPMKKKMALSWGGGSAAVVPRAYITSCADASDA